MNIEQLREDLTRTHKEFREAKEKHDELLKKLRTLETLLESYGAYEYGLNFGFLGQQNPLTNFLKSDMVVIDPKLYCRQKVFIAAFNDYCKYKHYPSLKWTNQFYAGPFSDFGIKILNNARKRYPNEPEMKIYTETFITGVDVKNFNFELSDESDSE